MSDKILKKKDLPAFLTKLRKNSTLIAPMQRDILRFDICEDTAKVVTNKRPLFTAKKYFYKEKQELFSYNKANIKETGQNEHFVIFGMRLCDINSLLKLDKLFLNDFEESNYKKARKNNIIIGLNCETAPSKYCFCESMELKDAGYDLFFCDAGVHWHIKVGSKKGEKLVKNLKDSYHRPKPIKTKKKLHHKEIAGNFNDKNWQEMSDKCISCGACTNLCPNCLCFDIFDTPSLALSKGVRNLEWDSCQFKDFTKVAGDHVFRETRESRLRHRIFHKIMYFKDQFDEYMCTGCGRCIEGCPTRIDWVQTLNKMKK
ncbi:4Fe-4S binding protein [Candidatus Woesearchaeota archaeon]|nr:4Fe-4S binding protein [Candidatus Woesearchaeota archaeon]